MVRFITLLIAACAFFLMTKAQASDLAAGNFFTCLGGGTALRCWGSNDNGQLGNGTEKDSPLPKYAVGTNGTGTLGVVSDVTAGFSFACAQTGGNVFCWGSNDSYELGDYTPYLSWKPVMIKESPSTALASVDAISAGGNHACALRSSLMACWGSGNDGALGDNSTDSSPYPIFLNNPSSIVAIASGGFHTCAIYFNVRNVACWGDNASGQLGAASSWSGTGIPISVVDVDASGLLDNVDDISAGNVFTCALRAGQVLCWGDNEYGQVGNGTTTNWDFPQHVILADASPLSNITKLSAGSNHVCARKNDGTVYCWGANDQGQLGDGTTISSRLPVRVRDADGINYLDEVVEIAAGGAHTCALKASGDVFCWGYNANGQLGNGTFADSHLPTKVDLDTVFSDGFE